MMGANDTFTIDELARAAGMTPRNVRAYRTKGLLPPPDREGRASRYRTAHLYRLRDIRGLREAGLPLKMIIEAAKRGDDLGRDGPLWRLSGAGVIDVTDRTAGAGASGGSASTRVIDLASDGMSPHGVSPAAASAGIERSSYHVSLAVTVLAEALCADLGGTVQDLPAPVLAETERVVIELVREAVADLVT